MALPFFLAETFLPGCTWIPTMVSQGVDVATTVAEHRSIYSTAQDYATRSEIRSNFLDENLLLEVSTDVYKGRVMLTGLVKNDAARKRAEELARQVGAVRELFNEIQIADQGSIKAAAQGLVIEAKLKAKLLTAEGVRSINYRWRAINGVVYLLGTSGSPDELTRVVTIVQGTEGVRAVVTHVTSAGDENSLGEITRARAYPDPQKVVRAQVISVQDGQTITVLIGNKSDTVHLIGADALGLRQSRRGKQAHDFLTRLVRGKIVSLETDAKRRNAQKHLFAYVYVGALLVNLELIREGQAVMETGYAELRYVDEYRKAQEEARKARRGIWAQAGPSEADCASRKGKFC
jgi:osmotically-inducible protein OsmY